MRILLTGPNGFVGARVARAADCIPCPSLRGARLEDVLRIVDETRPEAIIHTAAISDMGACQRDPESSWRANVEIPLLLARSAQSAKLVMFSTDQVYNGNSNPGPYREDEPISPVNVYARHKAEMEQRVLELRPDAVMLRATWMYDMPLYRGDNRGNFLMNIIKASLAGRPAAWSKQEFRGVTYVREAAEKALNAVQLPGGIYNFGSETTLTMYETAQSLLRQLGIQGSPEESGIGRNLWMDGEKLRRHGMIEYTEVRNFAQGEEEWASHRDSATMDVA